MIVQRRCEVWRIIQCGASGLTTSTRIALQILLNIPVLGRGVNNYCIVSPRIKDLRSQRCFLSLPPSITVVSEKDNLFNNNNKNFKYDSTFALSFNLSKVIYIICDLITIIHMLSKRLVNNNNNNCRSRLRKVIIPARTHMKRAGLAREART